MPFIINVGTDRNGAEPTNALKTEQEVFSVFHEHITGVSWATSPAIGDWPAERILVAKLDCVLLPIDAVKRLCELTHQHAIAVWDCDNEVGRLVWSDIAPEHVERFTFDREYFHFE